MTREQQQQIEQEAIKEARTQYSPLYSNIKNKIYQEGYITAATKYSALLEEKDKEIEALKEEVKEYRRLYFKQCRDSANE